jgi:N-acetylmuramoyl-L-alanine amidase
VPNVCATEARIEPQFARANAEQGYSTERRVTLDTLVDETSTRLVRLRLPTSLGPVRWFGQNSSWFCCNLAAVFDLAAVLCLTAVLRLAIVFRVAVLWFALLCLWPVSAAAAASVTQVERYASRDSARIVLYVSEPVQFERGSAEGSAEAGPRLYLDLPGASYAGPRRLEMKGLVERVRLVPSEGRLRVALELSDSAQQSVFFLPQPFRVVIDVARAAPVVRTAPAAGGGPAAPPGAGFAERVLRRIALDPGHGGSESGATGPGGIREKDIVLDIAHRAAPLLARELGVSTLLTRDTDERVALEERVAKANAFGADLFVSIHCNADPSRLGHGFISFVLDGSHDRKSVSLLERENAAPVSSGDDFQRFLEQFDDRLAAARSTRFARLLQRATGASLEPSYPDAVDGGVRGAGFYVLAGARMPAVLFETSFVSNEIEGKRLGTSRYRQKLADAIVNAVRAYKSGY